MGNTESVVPVIVQDTGMVATQEEYNGNTRRDSYFARYVSRGRIRTDIEN